MKFITISHDIINKIKIIDRELAKYFKNNYCIFTYIKWRSQINDVLKQAIRYEKDQFFMNGRIISSNKSNYCVHCSF